jgi:hypothetical protein
MDQEMMIGLERRVLLRLLGCVCCGLLRGLKRAYPARNLHCWQIFVNLML